MPSLADTLPPEWKERLTPLRKATRVNPKVQDGLAAVCEARDDIQKLKFMIKNSIPGALLRLIESKSATNRSHLGELFDAADAIASGVLETAPSLLKSDICKQQTLVRTLVACFVGLVCELYDESQLASYVSLDLLRSTCYPMNDLLNQANKLRANVGPSRAKPFDVSGWEPVSKMVHLLRVVADVPTQIQLLEFVYRVCALDHAFEQTELPRLLHSRGIDPALLNGVHMSRSQHEYMTRLHAALRALHARFVKSAAILPCSNVALVGDSRKSGERRHLDIISARASANRLSLYINATSLTIGYASGEPVTVLYADVCRVSFSPHVHDGTSRLQIKLQSAANLSRSLHAWDEKPVGLNTILADLEAPVLHVFAATFHVEQAFRMLQHKLKANDIDMDAGIVRSATKISVCSIPIASAAAAAAAAQAQAQTVSKAQASLRAKAAEPNETRPATEAEIDPARASESYQKRHNAQSKSKNAAPAMLVSPKSKLGSPKSKGKKTPTLASCTEHIVQSSEDENSSVGESDRNVKSVANEVVDLAQQMETEEKMSTQSIARPTTPTCDLQSVVSRHSSPSQLLTKASLMRKTLANLEKFALTHAPSVHARFFDRNNSTMWHRSGKKRRWQKDDLVRALLQEDGCEQVCVQSGDAEASQDMEVKLPAPTPACTPHRETNAKSSPATTKSDSQRETAPMQPRSASSSHRKSSTLQARPANIAQREVGSKHSTSASIPQRESTSVQARSASTKTSEVTPSTLQTTPLKGADQPEKQHSCEPAQTPATKTLAQRGALQVHESAGASTKVMSLLKEHLKTQEAFMNKCQEQFKSNDSRLQELAAAVKASKTQSEQALEQQESLKNALAKEMSTQIAQAMANAKHSVAPPVPPHPSSSLSAPSSSTAHRTGIQVCQEDQEGEDDPPANATPVNTLMNTSKKMQQVCEQDASQREEARAALQKLDPTACDLLELARTSLSDAAEQARADLQRAQHRFERERMRIAQRTAVKASRRRASKQRGALQKLRVDASKLDKLRTCLVAKAVELEACLRERELAAHDLRARLDACRAATPSLRTQESTPAAETDATTAAATALGASLVASLKTLGDEHVRLARKRKAQVASQVAKLQRLVQTFEL
ncbi:Hypothetical Protein FCC1311_016812 [Hondaea fermentalgiana]|uniref:Uncharacterized protein n=1 Tax=Hondaea fermentalgiana TaxID=2315210 RepID=A0A2R5GA88_9STRA|nr:Hypothetical Protein FCC1311_016812 [Hondaea fermentalgiana]|eukprot:GBG25463.1 Hypothetical Protein FCC1311_016812 [Hondaea fermentalgiana]